MKRMTAVILWLAWPCWGETGLRIDIENGTGDPITELSVFPLDAAGQPIDDNLGSSSAAVQPGAIRQLPLALLACGEVLVIAVKGNGQEVRLRTDLCQSNFLSIQP